MSKRNPQIFNAFFQGLKVFFEFGVHNDHIPYLLILYFSAVRRLLTGISPLSGDSL
jgi:hypothetical protein